MNAEKKIVAVIVAHPDDETLWAGGLLIDHPEWDVFVACLFSLVFMTVFYLPGIVDHI